MTISDLIISLLKTSISPSKIKNVVSTQRNRCLFRQQGFELFRSFLEKPAPDVILAHLLGDLTAWLRSSKAKEEKTIFTNIDCCFYKNAMNLLESFDGFLKVYIRVMGEKENLIKVLAIKDIFGVTLTFFLFLFHISLFLSVFIKNRELMIF